jgi:curved DNA-binding protein CbpA
MRDDRKLNYYAVLELSPTATTADIKKAWHEQLQVWHPDRFTHAPALHRKAEARTQLINQAYQTLSDPAARARYDAAAQPAPATTPPASTTPPSRPTAPPRPQPAPRARSESRGPQSLITLSRQGHPKLMVPPIHLLVDSQEHLPYEFHGFTRIAGTTRHTLPAGDYIIAEAPDLFCVERKRVEELYAAFSNPADNRQPFLRALERLVFFPHRFLVIEGTLPHQKAGGRLEQYHKNALMDFLDALTARYGIQVIYTEGRDQAEERVANLAAMHYAYFFAEQQGFGTCLNEDDL